jgi:HpaII restriction endonuclease
MLKGNKGDWSELYVFMKLLADGKLFQSDVNLEKDKLHYYEVTKAYREEGGSTLEFERKEKIYVHSISEKSKEQVTEFTVGYIGEKALTLYKRILNGKGNNFEIPDVEEFIKKTKIQKLTAKVTNKSDIRLRIYDHRLAKETDLGFSIKSLLGKDSTLFNTGSGNNFIYSVNPNREFSIIDFNRSTYKPEKKISKIAYRLQRLINEFSSKIKFKSIQSSQLWRNLKMIDGDLPEIIAMCLLYRWVDGTPVISELAALLEKRDPLNFYNGNPSEQKLYEYKLKKFLAECAMGMTSETPWHGIYDATGGIIICKEDGDIVCFHIYDFNLFREYLIKNTKFEQPSTGEDEENPGNPRTTTGTKKYYYGWLYSENNEHLFKINLQIRFI